MITPKQRAFLRKSANTLKPIFQIGKGGVNENMIVQINEALEAREIIKVHVLNNSLLDTKDVLREVAGLAEAEPVQAIGNMFVLYKESVNNKQIKLP